MGIIHVIVGGPSNYKGKNKQFLDDVLSMEKDTWAKQEVMFSLGKTKSNVHLGQ